MGVDDQTTKEVLAAVAQSAQSLSESEASSLETDKLDKLSTEIETKDTSSDDLSVPKWPKYTDPSSQKDEIQIELTEVKKQHQHWQKLYEASTKSSQDKSKFKNLSEFKKKQNEIDLQHNLTVQKIKQEIYYDREEFLSQLIKLQDEGKKQLTQQTTTKDEKKEEKKDDKKKDKKVNEELKDHGFDDMDEKEMTKDIMGDGVLSDKHKNAKDFDELDEIDS